jgi:hypothetical protein
VTILKEKYSEQKTSLSHSAESSALNYVEVAGLGVLPEALPTFPTDPVYPSQPQYSSPMASRSHICGA